MSDAATPCSASAWAMAQSAPSRPHAAASSPLLRPRSRARTRSCWIGGGKDLSLSEVNEAAHTIQEAAHPDANMIFGAMLDEKLQDEVWITVVATATASGAAARGTVTLPRAGRRAARRRMNTRRE